MSRCDGLSVPSIGGITCFDESYWIMENNLKTGPGPSRPLTLLPNPTLTPSFPTKYLINNPLPFSVILPTEENSFPTIIRLTSLIDSNGKRKGTDRKIQLEKYYLGCKLRCNHSPTSPPRNKARGGIKRIFESEKMKFIDLEDDNWGRFFVVKNEK